MKHPNQATLALHAGGDLGLLARWKTRRHLAKCERCRQEMADFEELREILPELAETPEISWNRLAAEMRANIRLGLAAGACVGDGEKPLRLNPWFTGARAAVALASIMAVVVTGVVLERPGPLAAENGVVFETTKNGIEVREGGRAFRLMNRAQKVTYSVGAQGSMSARYVDSTTGNVTINNVYAE